MYICRRKRAQGYLRSSLYNYLTQTTPAKSAFLKVDCIFGGGTNHDYVILFPKYRHPAFPCNSGGDPCRHDGSLISLRQRG